MASPEHCKRVARLLEHFFSQLVRDSTRGIKVARLTRDDQLGPQELKKFRLITKQNKGARRAGLSSRGLRALSPLSCSQSPPFFHCPLCPVEAPMIRITAASERNDVVTVAITSLAQAAYTLALNSLSHYLHKSLQQPYKER